MNDMEWENEIKKEIEILNERAKNAANKMFKIPGGMHSEMVDQLVDDIIRCAFLNVKLSIALAIPGSSE
ncbi:MAG: hypothetical protein O3B41_11685 [Bacteroidetes bacterium]|nr:hypothetical protein [Bacteroidota bacterium]